MVNIANTTFSGRAWPEANGMPYTAVAALISGLIGLMLMMFRIYKQREHDANSPAKGGDQRSLKDRCCTPAATAILAQTFAIVDLFGTTAIMGGVPCDVFAPQLPGFPWRWICMFYAVSAFGGYMFLYAKQKAVNSGPMADHSRTHMILSYAFLIGVCVAPVSGCVAV